MVMVVLRRAMLLMVRIAWDDRRIAPGSRMARIAFAMIVFMMVGNQLTGIHFEHADLQSGDQA